ncbi:VWA domain-containing protein [Legionella sp. km772]|uniref:VWA domain-containing protein n=1 Tax=Legionella sp. km772 TaxID=2498111 RepID=UPI000F8D2504|nr:VWA domain-containing protein [Legionella sp. km772]RUR13835.1 VWA domain-containing protein [Legionella sp. km772]
MLADFHFLRPWWLLATLPFIGLLFFVLRQSAPLQGWSEICDKHLLAYLPHSEGAKKQKFALLGLVLSFLFMIIAIAGPAWHKLPVPTYKPVQARVLILDMSENMLNTDLSPNRLSRAKFKLHDLLARKEVGQFGLIAYTSEPFVVSPLTDDGQTISSLLSALTPEVMPVSGQKLETALDEANRLIKQAGYQQGQILVLTSDTPSTQAIATAKAIAADGVSSSILPIRADKDLNPLFQRFALAGDGSLLPYSPDSEDLNAWLNKKQSGEFVKNTHDEIPVWRDEGPWFLIPALLFFLPVFQRGWLQRLAQ